MTEAQLIAEASGIVSKALFEAGGVSQAGAAWVNRKSREERIADFRLQNGIADSIPNDVIMQALVEDWEI